jgi:hypothetical protein
MRRPRGVCRGLNSCRWMGTPPVQRLQVVSLQHATVIWSGHWRRAGKVRRKSAAAQAEAASESSSSDPRKVSLADRLEKWGVAGFAAYGLLNTVYYTGAILVAWFYIFKVPHGIGVQQGLRRMSEVVLSAWALSQVTKAPRALGCALFCTLHDVALYKLTVASTLIADLCGHCAVPQPPFDRSVALCCLGTCNDLYGWSTEHCTRRSSTLLKVMLDMRSDLLDFLTLTTAQPVCL